MNARPHLVLALAAALMLLLALADWPYGYYILLRWVVCGASVFVAVVSYAAQKIWAMWPFVLVAILFNPLVPIYLTRDIWAPIDIVCAVVFLISIVTLKQKSENEH